MASRCIDPAMAAGPDLAFELDRWITQRMDTDGIPGVAVVLVVNDEVVYRAGHGVEDLSTGRQVTPDQTRFHLGSISKALTAQVAPPGELTIYSSVGVAVAGRVLETVTGQPFPEAIDTELPRPAGMTSTSFAMPPDDPATAIGHRAGETGLHAYCDPYFSLVGPGRDMVSTADDMTRFLLALLDERLIGREATRDMHRVVIRNHPAQRGRSLGFSEWRGRTAAVGSRTAAPPAPSAACSSCPNAGVRQACRAPARGPRALAATAVLGSAAVAAWATTWGLL